MNARELQNFLIARGARSDCPVCGHDQWAEVGMESGANLTVVGETADGELMVGVRVVGLACLNCAFLRLHSQNVMTDKLEYVTEGDH
jgi:hypothetical protein